jgi:hypothetical protein
MNGSRLTSSGSGTSTTRCMGRGRSGGSLARVHFMLPGAPWSGVMRDLGIHGVVRGKPTRTTIAENTAERPADLLNRVSLRPDRTVMDG